MHYLNERNNKVIQEQITTSIHKLFDELVSYQDLQYLFSFLSLKWILLILMVSRFLQCIDIRQFLMIYWILQVHKQ